MPRLLLSDERPAAVRPETEVPRRPLLRPGYRLVLERERVLLEHGHRVVVLGGRAATLLLPPLLPLLDGSRTLDELAAALGPETRPAVENALSVLAARRVVCEGPSLAGLPRRLRETAEMLAADSAAGPAQVAGALTRADVAVAGSSRVADAAAALLTEAGVRVLRPRRWRDARATLVVAAPTPAEAGALRRLNRRALRRGTAWLPVLPWDGRIVAVGPLVLPGETACYACYLLRRAAAVDYGAELDALESVAVAVRAPAPLERLAAELAALQALRWIGTGDPRLPGVLQTIELAEGVVVSSHEVLRVPRCPACSGLASTAPPLPWFDLPLAGAA